MNAFFLLFLVLFFLLFKYIKDRGLTTPVFVIAVYVVMAVSSVIYAGINEVTYYIDGAITTDGAIFVLLLLVLLLPLLVINEKSTVEIRIPSEKTFNLLSGIIVVASLYSVIFYSKAVLLLLNLPDLEAFRYLLVTDGHPFIKPNIFNTIATLAANFYLFAIVLFFISLILRSHWILSLSLFIASFSYPIKAFAYFGRDGVIFWLGAFFMAYLFFNPYMDMKLKRKVKSIIVFFIIILGALFTAISLIRFSEPLSVIKSVVSYIGQQPLVFIETSSLLTTITYGTRSFELFTNFFQIGDLTSSYIYSLGNNDYVSWMFGTIVKNFYVDFGFLGTLVFLLILSVTAMIYFCVNFKRITYIKVFVYMSYLQLIFQGVFYFTYSGKINNFYLLLLVVLALSSPFFRNSRVLIRDDLRGSK